MIPLSGNADHPVVINLASSNSKAKGRIFGRWE